MQVREVLIAAAGMLGRTDIACFLKRGIGSDLNALEGEIEALLRCYNLVETEVALHYRPLRRIETLRSADGKIHYSRLSKRPVKVEKVTKDGVSVPFAMLVETLQTASGEVEILYRYAPEHKTEDGESEFSAGELRALALGVACEYSLCAGLYEQAVTWDRRYRDELSALCRPRSGQMPAGRWI